MKSILKYVAYTVFSLLFVITINLNFHTEKAYAEYVWPESCRDIDILKSDDIDMYKFDEFKENYGYTFLSDLNSPDIDKGEKGVTFLKLFRDNLKCLHGLSQLSSGDGSGIVSAFNVDGIDFNSLKYNDFKQAVVNYEKAHDIVPDGVIDVQTSFLMGFHMGQGMKAISPNVFRSNECSGEQLGFNSAYAITDNIKDTEKEKLRRVIACTLKPHSQTPALVFDPINPLQTTSINDITSYKNAPSLLDGNKAGISLMYVLGLIFGLADGTWEPPPFDFENESSCHALEFGNENLFLINVDNASKSNIPSDENVKKASKVLNCLDHFANEGDIKGLSSFLKKGEVAISETTYGNILDAVYGYQKKDNNKNIFKDISVNIGNGLGSGSGVLDIKTAFVMGTQIGQLQKDNKNLTCKDKVINFESAHSISRENIGDRTSRDIKDYLIENRSNIKYLSDVISCLREPVFSNKSIPVDFFKNPIDNLWNENLNLTDYVPESSTGVRRVGIPLVFHLGKLFGKHGGKNIDENSIRSGEQLDYCAKYKTLSGLIDKTRSNDSVSLIPRNPGVIDWRDIKELDIPEECLTERELTASLIGKIIRFAEMFVGAIAVLMFIYGGFLYITARGEEQNSQKGLKAIITGVTGIFIVLMSRFVVEILVPISQEGIGLDRSKAFTQDVIANQQIVEITNWLLGFSSFVAISALIYGGYLWLVSGGDDNLHTKAITILRNTLIGFVIIFAAYTIVMVVLGGAGITN